MQDCENTIPRSGCEQAVVADCMAIFFGYVICQGLNEFFSRELV
jgi:hypothetical protein